MTALVITVAAVVTISAMCSLFEAVLYSVPASHVESLAEEGRPSGRLLKELRCNVDRPITAVLSLNTISNTAGAYLAGALAIAALDEKSAFAFPIAWKRSSAKRSSTSSIESPTCASWPSYAASRCSRAGTQRPRRRRRPWTGRRDESRSLQ